MTREEYLLNHPGMLFGGMASLYDPEPGRELQGILQFEVTDREEGECYFDFVDNRCEVERGRAAVPDLTITTPWEVWIAITNNEVTGRAAYEQGLFQAKGDLGLLMAFQEVIR